MTIQHGNRVRQTGGKQVAHEVQALEKLEPAKHGPTDAEIRGRADEIYLGPDGAPGCAESNGLHAEAGMRAHASGSRSNEVARSRGARRRS